MEKGVGEQRGKRKILTIMAALLVVGIITASLIYRGGITSRVTGDATKDNTQTLTESEAVNKLVNYLNVKYGNVTFFKSADLGSIYLVTVEHEGKKSDILVTKDGKFFSEAPFLQELPDYNSNQTNN